ncbi:MAG: hypothetical protein J7K98_01575 [Candidatus Aenigmarchaeota archaeon]|nr:hypothetical protein [Candidatus Aenigmarchaeota archaeon]
MVSQVFVLVFDFPRSLTTERRQLNRMLHRIGAKRLQDSLWRHEDLNSLMEVAMFIKRFGGSARILEERFVF